MPQGSESMTGGKMMLLVEMGNATQKEKQQI